MNSIRKTLAQYDIRPRKRLGQSFLEDMNMICRIAALVAPTGDETVVEIGAGLGVLTAELAKKAGRVIALEIDPRLIGVLRDRFAGCDKVEIVAGDVLAYDFSSACPGGRIKVVGNIPYYISTPILFRLIEYRRIDRIDGPDVPEGTGGQDHGTSRDERLRNPLGDRRAVYQGHPEYDGAPDLFLSRARCGFVGP